MHIKLTLPLSVFIITILLWGCNNIKDEYYERPDWLEPPIYQQLEQKGNFINYLRLVDMANYKSTLSSASYFTVFAPHDEAFEKYFISKNITSIEQLDTTTAKNIVRYSLAYNGYFKDELDDFQDNIIDTAQLYNVAFKRETSYYKWVHQENINGINTNVIDINGVGELPGEVSFNPNDNNNKHIPYFTDNFFANKNLSAYDYNYFYPNKPFNGFNVCKAAVVEQDLRAENGVIHVVDEVIEPLASIEDFLISNENYSSFFNLMDEYMKEYMEVPADILERFQQYTGSEKDVVIKYYNSLNFCPNCENFMKYSTSGYTHDAQIDGWSLFAPQNNVVDDFVNNVLLQHYENLGQLPSGLIAEFVNAHMFRTTVWPSKFETTTNYYGEPARFDPEANIIQKEMGSNGMFYGTNIIQETDAFYTVLGQIILDPQYSMYSSALTTLNLYDILKNPKYKFTVLLINNEMFRKLGFDINSTTGSWELENPKLGSNAMLALDRVVKMSLFLNKEYNDFRGDKLIPTYGGEYVRMQQGILYGAGNYHEGSVVFPKGANTDATNGITYLIGGSKIPLFYSVEEIGYDIEFNIENFSKYFAYLEKSDKTLPGFIYDSKKQIITGIKSAEKNTLLIPCDTAIAGAVRDGYLPEITDLPFTQDEQDMISRFINYHCFNGQIIVPGDEFNGEVRTLYKDEDGAVTLRVNSVEDDLIILDDYNLDVHLIYPKSNVLSSNAVIHLTDNYLKYKK